MNTKFHKTAEAEFLASYDPSRFDRPSVAVDVVLLAARGEALETVAVRRSEHPFKNAWALPGGFVRMEESLDDAAARVLREKAGLRDIFLEQLYTFGAPDRDPRTRVISVAYYALVDAARFSGVEQRDVTVAQIDAAPRGEDAGAVRLLQGGAVLPVAFDHGEIVNAAIRRIRGKLSYTPVAFALLPATFTLYDIQRVYQTVLNKTLNKDSFRKTILASGWIEATGTMQAQVGHRPARLYRLRDRMRNEL
jgi:8-oxo-dGTP diphosphatase